MGQIWHFFFLRTDVKKSQFCPIWWQSGRLSATSDPPALIRSSVRVIPLEHKLLIIPNYRKQIAHLFTLTTSLLVGLFLDLT